MTGVTSHVPNLFVIAGPNGAGKSTIASRYLIGERRTHEFVNADFIAEALLLSAREAVREAIALHKARGESIVVWRDGRVVVLQPDEIEL